MFDRGDIFLGNLPSSGRSFLKKFLETARSSYKRLEIPAVGKFAGVEAAVAAGWKPSDIYVSDVSLFSTVIGYVLSGQPLKDLHLSPVQSENPADILYYLKLAVLRANARSFHEQAIIRDLEARADDHKQFLQDGIDKLVASIGGINYQAVDLFEHLENGCLDNPETLMYINPPGYARGYEKMYNTGGTITWDEPLYEIFKPKEGHQRIADTTRDCQALVLRYKGADINGEDPTHPIFANEHRKGRTEYMLANYPELAEKFINRTAFPASQLPIEPSKYPILPETHVITDESSVQIVRIPANQALYYRDLFAHRLGATRSEQHFLLLVDGFICGVFGMHLSDLRRGTRRIVQDKKVKKIPFSSTGEKGKLYAEETYGFSPPSYNYPRLNRLLMMVITSRDFILGEYFSDMVYVPDGLATTCLARYPELKTNRGILKLVSREVRPDGLFHLRYLADARDESYSDTVKRWLTKLPPKKLPI